MEEVVRTLNSSMVISLEEHGETKMMNTESEVFFAEPGIFKIFDINIVAGDANKALNRPGTVMLSRKTAMRYFNTTDVVGKRLRADNESDLEITGVFENFPNESHWHPRHADIIYYTGRRQRIWPRTTGYQLEQQRIRYIYITR